MTPEQITERPIVNAIIDMATRPDESQFNLSPYYIDKITLALYAQAVSKPVGVNDESQPDYAAIAKECREKAEKTVPYLLRELGLLPKEEE